MTRNQPFTFEQFKQIYSQVPRLCVDLIISTDQGYLLTLRQKNGYIGQWHLVGGTVYFQEKITDTIQRVALEEIGTNVVVQKLLGYIEYPSEIDQRGFGYTISLAFLCELPENSQLKLDDQVEKHGFFQVLPDNTIDEQKKFILNLK